MEPERQGKIAVWVLYVVGFVGLIVMFTGLEGGIPWSALGIYTLIAGMGVVAGILPIPGLELPWSMWTNGE